MKIQQRKERIKDMNEKSKEERRLEKKSEAERPKKVMTDRSTDIMA